MTQRIVVGIDPSEGAERALRWALDEARLRGADVELVHAVQNHDVPAWPAIASAPTHEELAAGGEKVLDELLAKVDVEGVSVHREVDSGGAAKLLCQRAADADLVVVGTRGLGGFKGLLLGSVTQQVASHAPCPVVIVGAGD